MPPDEPDELELEELELEEVELAELELELELPLEMQSPRCALLPITVKESMLARPSPVSEISLIIFMPADRFTI